MAEAHEDRPDPLLGWVDDDLADRLAGAERVDLDRTAADLAAAEWATVAWADRAGADPTRVVRVTVTGAGGAAPLVGTVVDRGRGWLLLASSQGDVVVSTRAVLGIQGLPRRVDEGDSVALRARGIGAVLRMLSARGLPVTVSRVDGTLLQGSVRSVGADALDLLEHPTDRAPTPGDRVTTLPFAVLATVRAGG
jgi:hypothetical protein